MRRLALVLVAIAAIVLALVLTGSTKQRRAAPALPSRALRGAPVTLPALYGRPALIVFFASWVARERSLGPTERRRWLLRWLGLRDGNRGVCLPRDAVRSFGLSDWDTGVCLREDAVRSWPRVAVGLWRGPVRLDHPRLVIDDSAGCDQGLPQVGDRATLAGPRPQGQVGRDTELARKITPVAAQRRQVSS